MTTHLLDFNRIEIYEAGASLVTLLAYPGKGEEETRPAVHASLCHHALRMKCGSEPGWALSPQPIKPIYALRTPREVNQDLRSLKRRLRDRMAAGRMAIGLLKEAVTGKAAELPAGLTRLSINQMASLVLDDTGNSDLENVKTRIWRQSAPVIHLATAVQVFLQLAEPETGPLGFETFLLNRAAIECWVRAAKYHETIIAQSCRLRIHPDRLLKVRLG
jgi:hypothetical protein